MNRMNIETTFVDMTDLDKIKAALKPNTKAVFMESPSNPTLKITDISAVVEWAESHELLTLIDNTFMTRTISVRWNWEWTWCCTVRRSFLEATATCSPDWLLLIRIR